jgi:hypothetical protein
LNGGTAVQACSTAQRLSVKKDFFILNYYDLQILTYIFSQQIFIAISQMVLKG